MPFYAYVKFSNVLQLQMMLLEYRDDILTELPRQGTNNAFKKNAIDLSSLTAKVQLTLWLFF